MGIKHFLAIDQGTSGTKAIVVDEAGQVVSIAEVAVRPEYLAGGGVEQDPEALFNSVEQSSIPVDQDLLCGLLGSGGVVGPFDEFAVLELRAGADERHEMGRVDRPPA